MYIKIVKCIDQYYRKHGIRNYSFATAEIFRVQIKGFLGDLLDNALYVCVSRFIFFFLVQNNNYISAIVSFGTNQTLDLLCYTRSRYTAIDIQTRACGIFTKYSIDHIRQRNE